MYFEAGDISTLTHCVNDHVLVLSKMTSVCEKAQQGASKQVLWKRHPLDVVRVEACAVIDDSASSVIS